MPSQSFAQPSIMNHNFGRVPVPSVQRSSLKKPWGYKTTMDAGFLIPFFFDEVLPGDLFNLDATIYARLNTLGYPIMDNIFLDTFYFFVPYRLVWENWERFQGARTDPDDSTDYLVPQISYGGGALQFATGSLADYFGLPTLVTYNNQADAPNALFFRAYNLIWNEWFRDQNLQDSASVPLDDGPDDITDYFVRGRGKRPDIFTTCLPWPQKGDAVQIPLGDYAPVIGNGKTIGFTNDTDLFGLFWSQSETDIRGARDSYGDPVGSAVSTSGPTVTTRTVGLTTDPDESGMIADLSASFAATVNQLRESFVMQQILELDARGGTRYVEILKSRWTVDARDYRLQRPEYLGGQSQRVGITQTPQTSETTTESPQGNLAAFGQVINKSRVFHSFVEHGALIALMNIRTDTSYQQGMHRMWSRRERHDYYEPLTAHLGEEPILNKEIYFQGGGETDNLPFGYQERWSHERMGNSIVTGKFRSNATGSLDAWHLATEFSSLPLLNSGFIDDSQWASINVERVVAVTTEPQFLVDVYMRRIYARLMPTYSIPGLTRL